MIPKIKQTLLRLAIDNPGTKGRFKLAAGIVYKRRLVATKASLYVIRVNRDSSGGWQEALAKPCNGCLSLATETYGIGDIQWT